MIGRYYVGFPGRHLVIVGMMLKPVSRVPHEMLLSPPPLCSEWLFMAFPGIPPCDGFAAVSPFMSDGQSIVSSSTVTQLHNRYATVNRQCVYHPGYCRSLVRILIIMIRSYFMSQKYAHGIYCCVLFWLNQNFFLISTAYMYYMDLAVLCPRLLNLITYLWFSVIHLPIFSRTLSLALVQSYDYWCQCS